MFHQDSFSSEMFSDLLYGMNAVISLVCQVTVRTTVSTGVNIVTSLEGYHIFLRFPLGICCGSTAVKGLLESVSGT